MNSFLEFYQHLPLKLSPVIFQIGPVEFRWYSLSYIIGFTTVYYIAKYRLKKEKLTFNEFSQKQVEDMIFYSVLGGVIGGRVGYVLFTIRICYGRPPIKFFGHLTVRENSLVYRVCPTTEASSV